MYYHFNRLDIEVYTDYKDPDMEATIEEVLTSHELYYEKSEVWIETEKMYEVLYELTDISRPQGDRRNNQCRSKAIRSNLA